MAIGGLDVEIDGLNIRVEEGSSCPSIGVLKRQVGPTQPWGGQQCHERCRGERLLFPNGRRHRGML